MRKAIITIALLLAAFPIQAAEWMPAVSIAASYNAGGYPDSSLLHSSLRADAAIDALSLGIGNHRILLPLRIGYSTRSIAQDREIKQNVMHFGLEAGYGYSFSEAFSLEAGIGIRADWHMEGRFLTVSYGCTVTPWIAIGERFRAGFPISCYGSAAGWNASAGAAISLFLL